MYYSADIILLFCSSLFAATIFPAQSEAVLAALYMTGKYNSYMLAIIATTGNVLGSCTNWLLGRYLLHFKDKSWFPIKENTLLKSTRIYERWGLWTLLFAWLPVIGDSFTVIAGIFRTNFLLFVTLVTIGKATRYILLLAALSIF